MSAWYPIPGELVQTIETCDFEVAATMLAHGADPNEKGSFNNSALITSLIYGADIEFIKLLVNKGADAGVANIHGETPLMFAVSHRNVEALNLFLSKGVSLTAEDNRGQNVLEWANLRGDPEITKILVNVATEYRRAVQKHVYTSLRDVMAARLAKMSSHHDTSAGNQDLIRSQRAVTTVRARPVC